MTKTKEAHVKEAVGVFSEATQLKSAVDELLQSGFERSQLGILAGEQAAAG